MNAFRAWYIRNQDAITWFLIGLLTSQAIDALARRDYTTALISGGFALANYLFAGYRLR